MMPSLSLPPSGPRRSSTHMTNPSPRPLLLLLIAALSFLPLNSKSAAAAAAAAAADVAPVRNLGPSLAASAAAGTVVAVSAGGPPASASASERGAAAAPSDCCVILALSPPPSPSGRTGGAGTLDEEEPLTLASVAAAAAAAATAGDGDGAVGGDSPAGSGNATCASTAAPPPPPPSPPLRPLSRGHLTRTLSVLHPQTGLTAAVTGFAPDANHLILCAAKLVSNSEQVYGSGGEGGSAGFASVHRMVKDGIAQRISDAALSGGGRPFGVQALVVGHRPSAARTSRSASANAGTTSTSTATLQLYTIDPAGGWRHWSGGGTAVGRNAEAVRRCLARCLSDNNKNKITESDHNEGNDEVKEEEAKEDAAENGGRRILRGPPLDWTEALDRAMMATVEASSTKDTDATDYDYDESTSRDVNEDGGGEDGMSDGSEGGISFAGRHDAVVVFGGDRRTAGGSRCFAVRSDVVEDSYRRCVRRVAEMERERRKKRRGGV